MTLSDYVRRSVDAYTDLLTDPVVVAAAKRQFLDPAAFIASAVRRAAAAEAPQH